MSAAPPPLLGGAPEQSAIPKAWARQYVRVVVRHLPPATASADAVASILAALRVDEPHVVESVLPGKPGVLSKPATPARAYLICQDAATADALLRKVHGASLDGARLQAHVANVQKHADRFRLKNALAGSFLDDPVYQQFASPAPVKPAADAAPSATATTTTPAEPAAAPVSALLQEFLRRKQQQRPHKQTSTMARRKKAGKAAKKKA